MPEVLFRVRWPDGLVENCYSPSTIVTQFFTPGESYPLPEFLERSRSALHAASERVRSQYGMSCARAMAQLDAIEARARLQAKDCGPVRVEAFLR